MNKKIIFVIQPHSLVDTITNSSSELFVFEGNTKESIQLILENIYPNYFDEYNELKSTKELTNSELDTYVFYVYESWSNYDQQVVNKIIPGFTFEEMYREDGLDYKGRKEYSLRIDDHWNFVNNANRERVIKGIDPDNKMYFLFSIGDNPDWEMQEQLENLGTRYHLG